MKTLLVITDTEKVQNMINWAGRLSKAYFGPLTAVCCFKGQSIDPITPVTPERAIRSGGLLRAVQEAMNDSAADNYEMLELRHPDPVTAVLEALEERVFDLLIIKSDSRLDEDAGEESFAERLFRFAPCESLLVDPGEPGPVEKSRVIVPMGISMVKPTLALALNLVRQGGTVVPLLVGPAFGADARVTARKELEFKLREVGMDMSPQLAPDVIVAPNTMQGLVRAVRPGDTMLIAASSAQVLHRFYQTRNEKEPEAATGCTIAVFSPAHRKRPDRMRDWISQYLPKLNSSERVRVFDLLLAGTRFNPDFLVMMGMATAIAALGLLENSGAVVIGAMVVAPLMSPLIGAGFALVQGNIRLFNFSMRSIAVGILFGFFLSVLIGLLNPGEDLTQEIMARTTPDVRDLAVAFFSGAAAAYAFARPGLAGTLAGVAIAAALVPPLAAAGIGFSKGFWNVFQGAAILHATNLVAITLGAAATFRLLGIQGVRLGIGPALWARRAMLGLILALVLLSIPLGYKSVAKIIEGQARPMGYPISAVLFNALDHRIDKEPGVEMILTGRSPFVEHGVNIGILLGSEGAVSPQLRRDLLQIVKETVGEDAGVHIYILQNAAMKPEQNKDLPVAALR